MFQANGQSKSINHSANLAGPTPQNLKPSLVLAGLLAGAVAGPPEIIPSPVLGDAHRIVDNKTGAVASIRKWLTPLKGRRRSSTNVCQISQRAMERGPQTGIRRASTEDFTEKAASMLSPNAFEDVVQVWTSRHTPMTLPALLDTQCSPNMIREDIAREAGLPIEGYPGPRLSQADGNSYLPPGQVTTRIQFRGGKRTFKVNFLLAPSSVQYDIIVGGILIERAELLVRNHAAYFLAFARETPEQAAERQRIQQEEQRRNAEIERQRAEERRRQRERELVEQQRRQRERDRRTAASSSRRG